MTRCGAPESPELPESPEPLEPLESLESLESLQRAFAGALDDPHADYALVASLQSNEARSDAASPHERLGLYRGNVRAARRMALTSAYPVLAALAGDAWFDALALAYARARPTRDADLDRYGATLAGFVERYETDPRYAYFGDVARLEWALHAASFAADAVPLTPQQWHAFGAQRLTQARLAVHPACTALASRYAVVPIWRAHQPGGAAWPGRVEAPSWALVVRPRWRPDVLAQTEAAHVAFCALQRGATLDAALEQACAVDAGFDFASSWRRWVEAGAVVGLREDA